MTLADLIKEHEYDELIFGGFVCLSCSPNEGDDPDVVAWPCPPLRAAGMTDAHAVAHIENDRLRAKVERWRVELRDKGNDLMDVRGILSPNGYPRRVPMPLGDTVAPAVQWLVDEVERLRLIVDAAHYDIGDQQCWEGECPHPEDEETACPEIQVRYATCDDVLERDRLEGVVAAVKMLTVSTDGDSLSHELEIPIGEIVRVLAEGGAS